MRNKSLLFFFVSVFLSAAWVYASHPWLGQTLEANQVKQRWGENPIDEAKFKQATLVKGPAWLTQ